MIAIVCFTACEDRYIRKSTLGLMKFTPKYWQAKARAKCVLSICTIGFGILEVIGSFLMVAGIAALFNHSYPLSNGIVDLLIKLKINPTTASLIAKITFPIIIGLIPLSMEGATLVINEYVS
jgi:hypothetical protein